MATKRTGLGRGIGALIPGAPETTSRTVDALFSPGQGSSAGSASSGAQASQDAELVAVPGARLAYLKPTEIVPNPQQPRKVFDEQDLAELVHSIKEIGILQPVVVRPMPGKKTYELIMGERRLRASKIAGLESIPAIIKETADDDMLRDALLENLHRAQLNPLEEASAYQQLLADFGCTQEELAERIGRSRPQISNTLRLLKLPPVVQKRVAAGVLSAGHARAILSVGEPTAMAKLADKIVNEELSVRAAEALAGMAPEKKTTAKKPQAGGRTAMLNDIADRLGDRLNTRVKISLSSKKGLIGIEFASVQDLNRILEELGEKGFGQ
jgi:ParB family chromosome partitioning protein